MRLTIYVSDDALRAALLAWAQADGHAVLDSGPEVPAAPMVDVPWPLYALEATVVRLEPDAVLVHAAWSEAWADALAAGAAHLAGSWAMDNGGTRTPAAGADDGRTQEGIEPRPLTEAATGFLVPAWLWPVGRVADARIRAASFALGPVPQFGALSAALHRATERGQHQAPAAV